jgi:hypothetical protein
MKTRTQREPLGSSHSVVVTEGKPCFATVDTSHLTNIFEKVIDPMLRSLHVEANKCPLVRALYSGGEGLTTMDGETFYISVQHSKHSNMQTQAEGATLLRGRSRDDQMNFTAKDLNGSFTITYRAKKASQRRAGALVDKLMNETETMLERAKLMQAFYANNDGTGIFALVNDNSPNSKSTVTIDNVRGSSIEHILNVGDSIMSSGSGERTAGTGFPMTVASIDSPTQITVVETTSGMADDDQLHFSEAYNVAGSEETSKVGVDGLLITSGTLQGLSLTNRAYLKTNLESTGEAISELRVMEYLQLADPRIKDSSKYMVTMGNLWYKFVTLLRGTAYSNVDSSRAAQLFVGGGTNLKINWFNGETPVVHDPFCRTGQVYGLDLNQFGYKQLYPLQLVEDAAGLAHRITQKLEYEVVATESGNFYVIDPKACFKMTGKTIS